MRGEDLLSIRDLSADEINQVVSRARRLAAQPFSPLLAGKTVALLFEKPSLRTKASFDLAVHQLGGHPLYLGPDEVGLGKREAVSDVARVLSRYVDCIVARVNEHSSLEELGEYASVPVINALSDLEHPCQVLADLQTIAGHKKALKGLRMAFVGDGNNVARSLCLGAASVGMSFAIASPSGYGLDEDTLSEARSLAESQGQEVVSTVSPPGCGVGGPTWSTPTSGRAWDRKGRRRPAAATSRAIPWTLRYSSTPIATPFSCTTCLPTTARRSRRGCWSTPNL